MASKETTRNRLVSYRYNCECDDCKWVVKQGMSMDALELAAEYDYRTFESVAFGAGHGTPGYRGNFQGFREEPEGVDMFDFAEDIRLDYWCDAYREENGAQVTREDQRNCTITIKKWEREFIEKYRASPKRHIMLETIDLILARRKSLSTPPKEGKGAVPGSLVLEILNKD